MCNSVSQYIDCSKMLMSQVWWNEFIETHFTEHVVNKNVIDYFKRMKLKEKKNKKDVYIEVKEYNKTIINKDETIATLLWRTKTMMEDEEVEKIRLL